MSQTEARRQLSAATGANSAGVTITPRFWIANRVTSRSIDLLFKIASASVVSQAGRRRFLSGGIDPSHLSATLRQVRGLRSWPVSWVRTAGNYLADARKAERYGDTTQASTTRASAALSYHFAQLFEFTDIRRKRYLYGRAVSIFREAIPAMNPTTEPIEIPWRNTSLPGYARFPSNTTGELPLVVLLNGASTVKEETVLWSKPFLDQGIATLALDTPGSGEAWDRALGKPNQEDIATALIEFAVCHPRIDASRIAVLGISLRGALAVQMAVHEPRLAAAISVTAPYDPAAYVRQLNGVVRQELSFATGLREKEIDSMARSMSLANIAPNLTIPLLVVGAGNDLIVPPIEANRLFDAAGGSKQLIHIPGANHVAFSHLEEWTERAADWLAEELCITP